MTEREREIDEARAALALCVNRTSRAGPPRYSSRLPGSPRCSLLTRPLCSLMCSLLQAGGRAALVRQGDPAGERPRCAGCGEPIELEDPDDVESWIHAHDANDRGDHTAWLDE